MNEWKKSLFSFLDGIHLLLFLEEFLHSSLDDLFDHLILIECRMALIAGFHFDRTRDSRIYGKFSSTDAIDFYILEIISMYSGFHW